MSSPLTQCVGPEFSVGDDNVLSLRLAGSPANTAEPASGNGLRLDPLKGLWTPAEHRTVQVSVDRTDSPGAVVNVGGTSKSGRLETTVTNPSPTRDLLVMFTASVTAVMNIAAATTDDPYTGWSLLLGYDVDAVAGTSVPTPAAKTKRDQGISVEAGFTEQASATDHALVPAGTSLIIRTQAGVSVFEHGYARYVHTYLAIRGIGVTL